MTSAPLGTKFYDAMPKKMRYKIINTLEKQISSITTYIISYIFKSSRTWKRSNNSLNVEQVLG